MCAKGHSPSKVYAHFRHAKGSMSKKFEASAKVCACNQMPHMTKLRLVIYIYIYIYIYIKIISQNQDVLE